MTMINKKREYSTKGEQKEQDTYRESLCQHLFTFPPRLTGYREELHVALGEVRSVVGVKYEHAASRRDDAFTCRKQRAMLFVQNKTRIHTHPTYTRI